MNITGIKKLSADIIAHRGASFTAPENTLAAVRLAWELGADGVEIDIRQSVDGRIVLMHDPTAKRTTGAGLAVHDTTSSELRTLDAGLLKTDRYAGEKIPFLEEVISDIPNGRMLFIEIKCVAGIFGALEKIIDDSGNSAQLAIIGFNADTMAAAKIRFPLIPVYWLCDAASDERTGNPCAHDPRLIDAALKRNFQGLSLNSVGITPEFAELSRSRGIKLYAWTVNDPEEAKRLIGIGVHGLVTDRPGWLRDNTAG
jgi:glycerophosphoryl diester phosphodiesterase